jgi:hypothetical protein
MSLDKHKYMKYKLKYMKLKNTSINQSGGENIGIYMADGKHYRSHTTLDGKMYSYYEKEINKIDKDEITQNLKRPEPDKILVVDTIALFDHLTSKYGSLNKTFDIIYIRWDKLKEDYKGFYLDQNNDLAMERRSHAMFKYKRYISWWGNEYRAQNVIIFNK